ncbi:hypothetical protein OAH43_00680 [bacterium]|nr:hypothetical protein [bacterium]
MRYIFIYYNILYIILLILIFIYIKKILNTCYNIEEFEGTHESDDTKEPVDATNKPVDEVDEIFEPIIKDRGRRRREILSKLEDNEREKYIIDPKNKTNIDDIKLYPSKYADTEKIIDEIKTDFD